MLGQPWGKALRFLKLREIAVRNRRRYCSIYRVDPFRIIAGKLIKYFKSNGCVVIHKCTTIRHPQSAVKLGIDVLSIDGFECKPFICIIYLRNSNLFKVPDIPENKILAASYWYVSTRKALVGCLAL
jgi:hypothetical protein